MSKVVFCLSAVLVLCPGCGLFEKPPQPIELNRNVRLSGRVDKVNKNAGYVLIRRYGPWRVGAGQVVESRGEGRTSSLLPTGERLGEHVAADIRSGDVEVGDGVYIRRISTSEQGGSSVKPERSAQPDNQADRP